MTVMRVMYRFKNTDFKKQKDDLKDPQAAGGRSVKAILARKRLLSPGRPSGTPIIPNKITINKHIYLLIIHKLRVGTRSCRHIPRTFKAFNKIFSLRL